jgi:hypothetical protein
MNTVATYSSSFVQNTAEDDLKVIIGKGVSNNQAISFNFDTPTLIPNASFLIKMRPLKATQYGITVGPNGKSNNFFHVIIHSGKDASEVQLGYQPKYEFCIDKESSGSFMKTTAAFFQGHATSLPKDEPNNGIQYTVTLKNTIIEE